MLGDLTGWHMIIILAVVLLLFGATKLPALSKSVAQSARIFRTEMKANRDEAAAQTQADATQASLDSTQPTVDTAGTTTSAALASNSSTQDH
jgi:sec-independent protein translocase protein TatA